MQKSLNGNEIVLLSPAEALRNAKQIVEIYKNCWIATYPNENLGITESDIKLRFEDFENLVKEWKESILNSKKRTVWIAKNNQNKIIGFCIVMQDEDINELEFIYLLPEAQGKGFGTKLMHQALEKLGNSKPIVLYGAAYNDKAIKFYEKFGFKLSDEIIPPKVLPNGKKLPSMKMIKNF